MKSISHNDSPISQNYFFTEEIFKLPELLTKISLYILESHALLKFETINKTAFSSTQMAWKQLKEKDGLDISWELLENTLNRDKIEYFINCKLKQFIDPVLDSQPAGSGPIPKKNSFSLAFEIQQKYGKMISCFSFLKIYFDIQKNFYGHEDLLHFKNNVTLGQLEDIEELIKSLKQRVGKDLTLKESGENLFIGLIISTIFAHTKTNVFVKSSIFGKIQGNDHSMNILNAAFKKYNFEQI